MRNVFNSIIIGLFILTGILLYAPPTHAAQLIPNPGQNCGVGYPDDAKQDPNAVPDVSPRQAGEKYACCYSNIGDFLKPKLPESITNIPVAGPFLEQIAGVTDILNFPNNLLPVDVVPSFRTLLTALSDVENTCLTGEPVGDPKSNTCYCKTGISPALKAIINLCDNIQNPKEVKQCQQCLGFNPDTNQFSEGGIWTSIGCIRTNLTGFIQETVFGLGIGFAGLTALGCIIYAAILLQTSRGDAEKIKTAQEILRSCIFGLLLIIFSIFILRLIGVTILRIPGLS